MPPSVRGEQTKLLIISVLQPLVFCALIKGAVSNRRLWAEAGEVAGRPEDGRGAHPPTTLAVGAAASSLRLIVYVCETDTKAHGGSRAGGWSAAAAAVAVSGVFIVGTDALKRACLQDNGRAGGALALAESGTRCRAAPFVAELDSDCKLGLLDFRSRLFLQILFFLNCHYFFNV